MSHRHRRIWQLAWPMMLANASEPLLGVVDTALLGHLSEARYLAAVAIGSSALTMLFWLFSFLRMGSTPLVAQACGAGLRGKADQVLAQALVLGGAISIFLWLLQPWLLPWLLQLMVPEREVQALALHYCQIRMWAAPAVLLVYGLSGWFLGQQWTRATLAVVLVTNISNVLLDAWFILVLDWQVAGAAWATVISQFLGLTLALWLVRKRLQVLNWRPLRQFRRYLDLLRIGRHLFVRTACLLFTMSFFTAQGARMGDDVVAANAILMNLLLLSSHSLDAFAQTAETLIGRAIGARDITLLQRHCRDTSLWALVTAVFFCALFVLGQAWIVAVFTDLQTVAEAVHHYYHWLAWLPIVAVWSYQLDGIFIGASKTAALQNSMLISTFAVFLPLWWCLSEQANTGLWIAFWAFTASRVLTLAAAFVYYTKRKRWLY